MCVGQTVTSTSTSHFYSLEGGYASHFQGFSSSDLVNWNQTVPEATLLSGSSLVSERFLFGCRHQICRWRLLLRRISRLDRLPLANGPAANTITSVQRLAPTSGEEKYGMGLQATSHPPPAAGRLLKGRLESVNERRPSTTLLPLWCHCLCRCFFCFFQWMFKSLHRLHCSPPFARPLLPQWISRTDDGSGSAACRSQDVGSGSRFRARGGGSVRPVHDAAAWASLWIQKHLRGRADQSRRRFWFVSRVLARWTSALYFLELNICLNKWPLIRLIIIAGLKAKSSATYVQKCMFGSQIFTPKPAVPGNYW